MKRVIKWFGLILVVLLLYVIFHPERHAYYYNYVEENQILNHLVPNFELYNYKQTRNLKECEYDELVKNIEEIANVNDYLLNDFNDVLLGGEYKPNDCIPKYSTAVIVCYRNRPQQLDIFLKYMHWFLRKQNIHYRIFIADQNNTDPFNRALMLNHGSVVAMNYSFPCLILHDVDLLPLNIANIYACTNLPRHLSCSIDTMRFNLPYYGIVGGVLAIQSMQFKMINGMSNEYFGWGGEDDDLYKRMYVKKLYPIRFSPSISRYTMLKHKHETPSPNRYEVLSKSLRRQFIDGLNTLNSKYVVKLEPLYTHVIVN